MWVPTCPPVTMISLAAEPPSGRTMSPWRRTNDIWNGGWLADCGIPRRIGCARSTTRAPASAPAISAVPVATRVPVTVGPLVASSATAVPGWPASVPVLIPVCVTPELPRSR